MKIFSWVHSQFHKKSVADHEDAKKAENVKVSLLDQNEGVCDGWKEGILTIGTLGIDLSKTFQVKDVVYTNNQFVLFDHEHDDEDHEGEMECPLMLKASKHGFHHVQKLDPSPCEKVAKDEVAGAKHSTDLDTECTEKKIAKSGGRTTLADLLWGDSEKNLLIKDKLCDHRFNVPYPVITSIDIESINNTLISKKKKIERDDSTHPIKKTKRLMRKMLKKKIHPDMGSQKKETAGIIYQETHVHAT